MEEVAVVVDMDKIPTDRHRTNNTVTSNRHHPSNTEVNSSPPSITEAAAEVVHLVGAERQKSFSLPRCTWAASLDKRV